MLFVVISRLYISLLLSDFMVAPAAVPDVILTLVVLI